jgi:predicted secreted hydrolase
MAWRIVGATIVSALLVSADVFAQGEADTGGFAPVLSPRAFAFPADHGPHRDYRHEWWYVTGNLDGPGNRRFGFQVTFFRFGLNPHPRPRTSHWAASEVCMAHFAITDVNNGRFLPHERRSRCALGLAGVTTSPLRVWLEDWQMLADQGDDFPWTITVSEGDLALTLTLRTTKPMVLQGEDGLSQKSAQRGNASYYYSATRLEAEGTVGLDGQSFPVRGLAWLDREWSSSALAAHQAGWDWFSLQFDDGTELMFYRLRLKNGGSDSNSAGSLVARNGTKTSLRNDDVVLEVLDHWQSPDGAVYPARWRMTIKPLGRTLLIRPVVADQELRAGSFRYWEGAVDVFEEAGAARAVGRGYLEMTGYAGALGEDSRR